MSKVIKAVDKTPLLYSRKLSIFLGGSINKGTSINWQNEIEKHLKDEDVVIYNPRRDDWDNTWVEDPTPGTKFHEQVTWELEHQEIADIRVYAFVGDGMSPITLLELGTFGSFRPYDTIVYVDKKYPRYGNVVITCEFLGIEWTDDFNKFKEMISEKILVSDQMC